LDTIPCIVCHERPAEQFITATFEIVTGKGYEIKMVHIALCNSCAALMEKSVINGQYVARALAAGGAK
jgi:hypothetical protein